MSANDLTLVRGKVLLVDDDDLGREIGRAMLENAGLEVSEASNGAEAVEKVSGEDFDLVFMDIQMPVMDGLSATCAIRHLDKAGIENLPIIAMSGDIYAETWNGSLTAGMNGYIIKPIALEDLYAELQRWLPEGTPQQSQQPRLREQTEAEEFEFLLSGTDVKMGMCRAGDDRSTYVRLLKKFVDQFADTEQNLRQEIKSGNKRAAIFRVHTLKGVAGNLGANKLFKLSRDLEHQLKKDEKLTKLEAFFLEHTDFVSRIQALPAEQEEPPTQVDNEGSIEGLRTFLEQLLGPLQKFQVKETKTIVEKLQAQIWPEPYALELKKLKTLIDRYQFIAAVEKVKQVLTEIKR